MQIFGDEYSKIYDRLYEDKDYEKECDFIETLLKRYNVNGKRILDLGCGTGGHALILAGRGYFVTGVDISGEMLGKARIKAKNAGLKIEFIENDITNLDLEEKFDVAISMFAVLGYQTTNESMINMCAAVNKHLTSEGIFILDCWNGNAVLSQRPEKCTKEIIINENEKITRNTTPVLDTFASTVNVGFEVIHLMNDEIASKYEEYHKMRFFFPQEISFMLKLSGFKNIEMFPFLELTGKLSDNDWNMMAVARKSMREEAGDTEPLEEIKYANALISIILRSGFSSSGPCFFGSADFSQQMGFLPHKRGNIIKAHFHKKIHRNIVFTQEVLFLRKGTIKVNFYTQEKEYICSRTINAGDVLFLCSGGHGFEILEDSEIIEVKQGPYSGRSGDKVVFKGIEGVKDE